jgi:small-conductance mechanosensitive channel
MTLAPEFWTNLLIAVGLGLGVSLVLWLFRSYEPVRRVRVAALLAAWMGGLYLLLNGLNFESEVVVTQIVSALEVLLVANVVLQLFDLLLWDYVLSARRHIVVPRLIVDVFNFVILAAVALAVLNRVFGVELSAFLVTSTVLSAVIGLALQDTLGNIISGLALQLERPFNVGDWIRVSGEEGQVTQVTWRTVTLKTRDHHSILIPNASAAKEHIINYSRPTRLQRMRTHVGVAYRHPPGLVKETLAKAVAEASGVAADPAPQVLVKDYGDFAVQYDLLYWITDFARVPEIHDAVMTRVWYALRRADMTIPFPVRDVTVRTLTDDYEARAQAQLRREVFAELRPLSVLAPLSDAQIEQLARSASLQRFTAGETLVRQGEAGDSLFVLKSGRVRVDKQLSHGATVSLAHLGPDEFFGEMSLLTGEPRSASVIAETETEVVIVEKTDLAEALASDFGVLEALSKALEERMNRILSREAAMLPDAAPAPRQAALLSRIQRFFGLGTGRLRAAGKSE